MNSRFVLVTGCTGQQGGAVAKALLKNGHRVRGMTRNADSTNAKQLAAMGAEIVVGDFVDPNSLIQATEGVDALYAMTTPFESGEEAETAQGVALIEAARQSGVGHFVYSSVGSADQETGIPHFDSKYKVEEVLVASGLPYSISAPVYFMENLLSPWVLPGLKEGTLSQAMPGERKLQQIALADIGAFATALIERRERVFGQRFNIAGDELSNIELVSMFSKITGREITYQGFPAEALKAQSEDMAKMYEWFDTTGYNVNISELHKSFPEVGWHDFNSWAQEVNWLNVMGVVHD